MRRTATASAVSFRDDIDCWVFDLDNTLYHASSHLFPQIDARMKRFIADALDLPPEAAFTLQKQYYHLYGTTLRGLILNHAINPDVFLDYVHDVDHSVLTPDPALASALAALPGRRLIYTNGSAQHAHNVLARLEIDALFDGVFDIRAADFIPKPHPESYRRMLDHHAVSPTKAVMFEDLARNLRPAAELGMVTVLVRSPPGTLEGPEPTEQDLTYIDFETTDLTHWLSQHCFG